MKALTRSIKRLIVFGLFLMCVVSLITACADDSSDSSSTRHLLGSEHDQKLPYTLINWMAQIDDDKYLSEIMIPGTHDSGADLHTSKQGAMEKFAITQHFYFSNQLKLGVRWFDIRLCLCDDGTLTVHHKDYYLHKNFDHLLVPALGFLKQNPTEIVVFMIKQENSEARDFDFGTHVYYKLKSYGIDNFYLKNEVPTIGEARGKIVIVRRFNNELGDDFGMQFDWNDNTKGEDFTKEEIDIYVQDHWSIKTVPYSDKINDIEKCLKNAVQEKNLKKFYLNFTSAYADRWLTQVASNIDPHVETYIQSRPSCNRGVILVNFAGGTDDDHGNRGIAPNFVKTIVNQNGLNY